jgi:hypothetical protein
MQIGASAVAVRRGSITTMLGAALLARASRRWNSTGWHQARWSRRARPDRPVQILVAARHDIGAEGALGRRPRRPCTAANWCRYWRADEALHQLVGDVIVLGQQLARDVEGHRIRPVLGDGLGEKPSGHDRAPSSQLAACRRSSGVSSRPSSRQVSPSADPLEQSRPKLAGWSGSPRPCRRRRIGLGGDDAAADPAIGAGRLHRREGGSASVPRGHPQAIAWPAASSRSATSMAHQRDGKDWSRSPGPARRRSPVSRSMTNCAAGR